jgi:FlaA1/EpsC-like NDP-sugar epimerase
MGFKSWLTNLLPLGQGRWCLAYLLCDFCLLVVALLLSFFLRFDWNVPLAYMDNLRGTWWIAVALMLFALVFCGVYRIVWRFAGIHEVLAIVYGVILGEMMLGFSFYLNLGVQYPRGILVLYGVLTVGLVGASRIFVKTWPEFKGNFRRNAKRISGQHTRVMIFGAGSAGVALLKEMRHQPSLGFLPVGFVDDSPMKKGMSVQGLPVLGDRYDLPRLINVLRIDELVVAIPSKSKQDLAEIAELVEPTNIRIKTVPSLDEIVTGRVGISSIKDVPIADLLGRGQIKADLADVMGFIKGRVVLVSGAGGSIGSELCRQLAHFQPKKLIMLDVSENLLFDMGVEFSERFAEFSYHLVLGNVQDRVRLQEIFSQWTPELVFHAAAHKHVPLMEANPIEALKNNVIGTRNMVETAQKNGCKAFVLISTDKAVNPTSVMGASKRAAEMVLLDRWQEKQGTVLVVVRFGNVLGSRGSVVPLFKRQIAEGGPVTVTHPEMVRYFMTIPEAVQLVMQAGAIGKGGEVFVLDMGEPVKIVDLARDLIRQSGFIPGEEIMIEFTGIRPGEKLYEELLTDEENVELTSHKKIFRAKIQNARGTDVTEWLQDVEGLYGAPQDQSGSDRSKELLYRLIPEYYLTVQKKLGLE